ncbi:hypothetical protein [Neobacillus muris]|uniref:hypothetical protein n=1 Tax=Neobacillus muris TaxID=2941334 RepID=UPI00203E1A04|nr:hypothetical protein [Neobacillus muris]
MKPIRTFIRYENGTYKIKDVPYSLNMGIQGLAFINVIEKVFELKEKDEEEMPRLFCVKETKFFFGDNSSELAFYKANDNKEVKDSRLLFFRKITFHNNPLSNILPVCVDLLDSDIDYLTKKWNYSKK